MEHFNQWEPNPTVNRETKRGGRGRIPWGLDSRRALGLGAAEWRDHWMTGSPDGFTGMRVEERERKKRRDRIVMQTRATASLTPFCPPWIRRSGHMWILSLAPFA
jgi:hypothetical protein